MASTRLASRGAVGSAGGQFGRQRSDGSGGGTHWPITIPTAEAYGPGGRAAADILDPVLGRAVDVLQIAAVEQPPVGAVECRLWGIPHKRHYFASLLIADGLDIKAVQMRLRHASAKTTLDVYGHMWPDKDEASRAAVAAAIAARSDILADFLRTKP